MTLPDRAAILGFLNAAPGAVGRREIAREFGISGAARAELRRLLQDMLADGSIIAGRGRSLRAAGTLPAVAVLKVVRVGRGLVLAEPAEWAEAAAPPQLRVHPAERRGKSGQHLARGLSGLAVGDRILARIGHQRAAADAIFMRRLPARARADDTELGIIVADAEDRLWLRPVDRRIRRSWPLHHDTQARPGELVRAVIRGQGARAVARVTQQLGTPLAPGAHLSDIAIAEKGIPAEFDAEALAEAERAAQAPLGPREDWSHIPFLTIDPEDARDHDDAVHAAAAGDGWRLLVAIADVAWFVRPGSALDRNARARGNSVYFPDRVVPMLPPALSAEACSLKAGAPRAALVAAMHIDAGGNLRDFRFHRVAIRAAANITYAAAQAAADGGGSAELQALVAPLWGCWRALDAARRARAPLELDLPEKQLRLDAAGMVREVTERPRLQAHRVIEDMMIAANVAAAKALEAAGLPLIYRCHDTPARERLATLKDYLATFGLNLALGQVVTPQMFNRILAQARPRPEYAGIAEAVLRAQMQACYSPRNIGHFGLSLGHYAHFTSPIRRYADLCVHRALVQAFALGDGGDDAGAGAGLEALAEHLGMTERRAMEAERATFDRHVARFLAGAAGRTFRARISGVQPFGFFATLAEFAGDGLVPVSTLGAERFHFDDKAHALEGVESGVRYQQGQLLDLVLAESDVITGSLRLALPEGVATGGGAPHRDRGRNRRLPRGGGRGGARPRPRRR